MGGCNKIDQLRRAWIAFFRRSSREIRLNRATSPDSITAKLRPVEVFVGLAKLHLVYSALAVGNFDWRIQGNALIELGLRIDPQISREKRCRIHQPFEFPSGGQDGRERGCCGQHRRV